jgi:uncharacterized membrane protein
MNKIVFVSFNNERQAKEGAQAMREVRTNVLKAGAIIALDPQGKIVVRQSIIERPAATLGGLLLDSLIGLLGPAAIAIDAGSGALLGAAIDAANAGTTTEFLQTIQKELAAGKTGIIAELDEEWESPIDLRMAPLGGIVFRQPVMQLEDAFFEKEIQARSVELARLEMEKMANAKAAEKRESAERDAQLQAKIDATKRKIEEQEKKLIARIQSVSREGQEKIAELHELMGTADAEANVELAHRVDDIRSEYELRTEKLNQALERCKTTHAA